MKDLIRNIKISIENGYDEHILEMYINEYIQNELLKQDDGYTYQDGYDEGYADCLKENNFEDEISWDYVRDHFSDEINDLAYEISRDDVYEKEEEIRRNAWDEGYREGEEEAYERGYEDGRKDGYDEGVRDSQ